MAQVALELSTYTINMWAILNKDNTVIGVFPPDTSEEERLKESCGKTLVEMTLENSPGWIGAKYINGKFV